MNQQEYQDNLMLQANLFKETFGDFGYVAGWVASQCVQMYELLTPEQQEEFAGKLLHSINRIQAERDGEKIEDNNVEIH